MRSHYAVLAVIVSSFWPAVAAAHVTIQPKQAPAKAFQEYIIRVPTEKDAPTTSVRMTFPQGFEVLRLRRTPGWKYEIERDASGRIAGVTWSGGTVGREEYEQFSFMARAATPGTYKLDAFQTYGASDVVAWVNEVEPRPAPQVTIVAATAPAAAPADPFADSGSGGRSAAGASAGGSSNTVERGVTAASLVIALVSLVVSGRAVRRSGA